MNARAVEEAASRLRELRREEWMDAGLAALALGLAIGATEVESSLAVPLLVGGVVVLALALGALWRRWDLVDRLVLDRDAYAIPEVRACAARAATMERRHTLASSIRRMLIDPDLALNARNAAAAQELEALASELDDDELALDPVCAVECSRLLSDGVGSPLFNSVGPADDIQSRILRIRSGFERRRPAA
jgi:hypothetical protein